MQRAFFLDRDGVLNKSDVIDGRPYAPKCIFGLEILQGVNEALIRLRNAGFLNIVVTNQPDISTGKQSIGDLFEIHQRLQEELALDDVLVCPHGDDDYCKCRKPEPGLLIDAANRWNIDLGRSFMIGDRWRDVEAGQRAGCQSNFFIDYGYSERGPVGEYIKVPSLLAAVDHVLNLDFSC